MITERLIKELVALRSRVGALERQESSTPTYTTWTPTLKQGVDVAATIIEARYCLIGKQCHLYCQLSVTGSGTAGSTIQIGGIPAAASPANYILLSYVSLRDVSEPMPYTFGYAAKTSASMMQIISVAGGWMGQTPPVGLANGDIITISAIYRVA